MLVNNLPARKGHMPQSGRQLSLVSLHVVIPRLGWETLTIKSGLNSVPGGWDLSNATAAGYQEMQAAQHQIISVYNECDGELIRQRM